MNPSLDDRALDQIFREARSRNGWTDTPVAPETLRRIYELMKWGPTASNSCPARFVFVTTPEAKARLEPLMSPGNRLKMLSAPVTVIIGYDLDFPATLTKLFPHEPSAPSWFEDPKDGDFEALRSGTLQGAYLMIAARALGLDCGPMGGFDRAGVDREFFTGTRIRSNFVCAIGEGSDHRLFPRLPRLDFDEACRIV